VGKESVFDLMATTHDRAFCGSLYRSACCMV
jgi:hypothetical protein